MEACNECSTEISVGQSVLLLCDCGYVICKDCCIQLLARSAKTYHLVECPQCKSESDSVRGRDKAYATEATLVKSLFDKLQVYRKKGGLNLAQIAELTEQDYLDAFRELNKRIDSNQMINKGLRELLKDAKDITLNGKSDQEIRDLGTLNLKLTLARVESVIASDKPARKHKFINGPLEHISFIRNIHLENLVAVRKERDRLQKHLESQDATNVVTSQLTHMKGKLNAVLEAIEKQNKYLEGISLPSSSTLSSTSNAKSDSKAASASARRNSNTHINPNGADKKKGATTIAATGTNTNGGERVLEERIEVINSISLKKQQWENEEHMDVCEFCNKGGNLLCCDNCTGAYHLRCLQLTKVPEGEWLCPYCVSEREVNASGSIPSCESSGHSSSSVSDKICAVPGCNERVFSSHHLATLCVSHRQQRKRKRNVGADGSSSVANQQKKSLQSKKTKESAGDERAKASNLKKIEGQTHEVETKTKSVVVKKEAAHFNTKKCAWKDCNQCVGGYNRQYCDLHRIERKKIAYRKYREKRKSDVNKGTKNEDDNQEDMVDDDINDKSIINNEENINNGSGDEMDDDGDSIMTISESNEDWGNVQDTTREGNAIDVCIEQIDFANKDEKGKDLNDDNDVNGNGSLTEYDGPTETQDNNDVGMTIDFSQVTSDAVDSNTVAEASHIVVDSNYFDATKGGDIVVENSSLERRETVE